jgi:hypothetical protein
MRRRRIILGVLVSVSCWLPLPPSSARGKPQNTLPGSNSTVGGARLLWLWVNDKPQANHVRPSATRRD